MTPKDKAKELVDKMVDEIPSNNSKDMMTFIEIDVQASKQCALIAVDEIMKAPHENQYIELIPTDAESTDWFWDKFDAYWNEVKTEIEKL